MKNLPWVAILLLLLGCCASAPQTKPQSSAAQELAKLKASVMSADYRADFDALTKLRDELAQWPRTKELAYLARYWSGYASWRIAMNGANHAMKREEMAKHLHAAATDFYTSTRLEPQFADAWSAAALVNSWLATFDADTMRERLSLSQMLFARAEALDARNPRVLWAKAAFLLFTPASQGGSVSCAINVYRRMLAEGERRGVDASSPLPDWGKPEALMSIAFARLQETPADLTAARAEAQAALEVVPEWSYVRDTLLPQIDERMRVGK
ncbi:MAG TPA: hypothetical protein VGQ76_18765 [Thermoanaerobaculia bacterium]|nr:hypothetical protein [Thermoanaerobaculia bacterium]